MPLKVKDESQVRDYVWVNPEDGYRIDDGFYWRLQDKAKAYRSANHYPVGSNWVADFEANVCAHSGGVCEEFVPPTPRARAASVVQAVGRWARSGLKTRTPEEIEAIMDICKGCSYYSGETGLFRIHCQRCGCTRLKLHLRSEKCPLNPPKWT